MGKTCENCASLLSEALDLCIRARNMDAQDRTQAALDVSSNPEEWQRHGTFERWCENASESTPHAPYTGKSGTVPQWLEEEYQKALHDWEERTKAHLLAGCSCLRNNVVPIKQKEQKTMREDSD